MSGAWSTAEGAQEWQRLAAVRNAALKLATDRMLALANVGPGSRVLVLGAGTGDDAAIVAGAAGPQGRVLATDVSPAMVEVCAATMRGLGLAQVESRVMDAAAIDVPEGSFDAVVSRNGLMFTPALDRALSGARRALAPGGRFAAVTWSALERNPFHGVLLEVAERFGLPPGPTPELVLAYSLSDPDALDAALVAAGFSGVTIERVPVPRRYASVAEAVDLQRRNPAAALFAHLDEATRERAWDAVAAGYEKLAGPGGVAADGEALVTGARRG